MESTPVQLMTKKKNFRRKLLAAIGLMVAGGLPVLAAVRKTPKELIASVPVFPWLNIGQTTLQNAQGPIQAMLSSSPPPLFREGPSEITGGSFMTVSSLHGSGMLGETGLRVLTIVFDKNKCAQLAIFVVDRGWNNANTQPLLNRIAERYSSYAEPVRIQDAQSDATDVYYFFDLGRFVIEISVPQFGDFLQVVFTTKEIHAQMRMADRTYDLFKPYLGGAVKAD